MAPPREKFFIPIDAESFQNVDRVYLNVGIWPGTKDPTADVIQVRISGLKNDSWEEIGRISIYRDGQGYRELPPRQPPEQRQEPISKKESTDTPTEESEDNLFLAE